MSNLRWSWIVVCAALSGACGDQKAPAAHPARTAERAAAPSEARAPRVAEADQRALAARLEAAFAAPAGEELPAPRADDGLSQEQRDLLEADFRKLTEEQRRQRALALRAKHMNDPNSELGERLRELQARIDSGEYAATSMQVWRGAAPPR